MPGPVTVMQPRADADIYGRDAPGDGSPPPSWGEAYMANWRLGQDEDEDYQVMRTEEGWQSLEDELVRLGYPRSRYHNPNWSKPRFIWDKDYRKDQLWADVGERKKVSGGKEFSDIPEDRKGFEAWVIGRKGGRARDMITSSRGPVGSSLIPSLLWGATAPWRHPETMPTMFIGGGARTLAGTVVKQYAAGYSVAAITAPQRLQDKQALGESFGFSELFQEGHMAGLTNAGFVVGHAGLAKAGRFTYDRLPLDYRLAQQLKREVPVQMRTPDMQAAIHVVERGSEIDMTSPWRPSHQALDAHAGRMQATIDALEDPPLRPVAPVPAASAAPSRPIAAGFGGDREAMLDYVVRDLEGGPKLVTDSGGLTKYGISANANPGVDIANLTEGQAKAIYRSKYIAPLKMEGRSPEAQLVALDASVNHGPKFARKILAEADGDPAKMIALRRAEYARLVREDPGKYERYAKGWENRLQKIEQKVGLRPGEAGTADAAPRGPVPLPERPAAMDAERPLAAAPDLELDPAAFAGSAPVVQMGGRILPTNRFKPHEIGVDAELMQFKSGGDQFGVTERLQGIQEWDPMAAGMITVWEAADGRRLVADGHQRLGLAKRIMASNPDANIEMPAFVLREADGITARDARVLTALKNIGEGTGSAKDAAKVLRDAGPEFEALIAKRLPPRSALVRDGKALARLSDEAFGAVVNGVIPEGYAAAIGHLAPDPTTHMALVELVAKLDPANRKQAEAIVRQAIDAGFAREVQNELFGARELTSALFAHKAKALDRTLGELRKMKGIFQVAARNAETLEGAGNQIAVQASEAAADANARALALIDALALRKGNAVNDVFNRAAERLANGERIDKVVKDIVAELGKLDLDELARGSDAAEPGSAAADGNGDGLGGSGRDGFAAGEADPAQLDAATLDELEAAGQAGFVFADEEAHQAFDDPAGPGVKAASDSVWHDIKAAQARASEAQLQADIETVLVKARANQAELADFGGAIKRGGVRFIDNGVKKADRIATKVREEGYASPAELRDVARAAFVVSDPAQADELAAAIATRFPGTIDKGWKQLGSNYLDRKQVLTFPNGGYAELQIVPDTIWHAKTELGGGSLYKLERVEKDPAVRAELRDKARVLYAEALADTPFDGIAARSASGNLAAKSASESSSPSIADLTNSPGASRQVPADQAQARPVLPEASTATGRSSTSNNSSFTEGPPLGDAAALSDDLAKSQGKIELFDLDDGKGNRTIAEIEAELKADDDALAAMRECLK